MNNYKTIGWSLIIGVITVVIPYTILTVIFEYPNILRQETGSILTKFYGKENKLIFTWWCFAISAIPLLIAFVKIGEMPQLAVIKWATTFAVIAVMAQAIGLLRWVFVVPVLAANYVNADNPFTREIAVSDFKLIHQFGGVLLGEHIGQLFTVIWTIVISISFLKSNTFAKWKNWLGLISSIIYLSAQAEIFNTVISSFPYLSYAGLAGSTLWLLWLLLLGFSFLSSEENKI